MDSPLNNWNGISHDFDQINISIISTPTLVDIQISDEALHNNPIPNDLIKPIITKLQERVVPNYTSTRGLALYSGPGSRQRTTDSREFLSFDRTTVAHCI